MTWYTIEALRVRAGLPADDPSKDTELATAADMAMDIVEDYLGRGIDYREETQEFFDRRGAFVVRRYPIDPAQPITINDRTSNAADFDITWVAGTPLAGNQIGRSGTLAIDARRGIFYHVLEWYYHYVGRCDFIRPDPMPLTITFTGGYDPLPPALFMAMNMVFDSVWASDPNFGGGGGIASGAMKKVSLVGIGAIEYDLSGSATSSAGDDAYGLIPGYAAAILARYRSIGPVGY